MGVTEELAHHCNVVCCSTLATTTQTATPETSPPLVDVVHAKMFCCWLAVYLLWKHQQLSPEEEGTIPEGSCDDETVYLGSVFPLLLRSHTTDFACPLIDRHLLMCEAALEQLPRTIMSINQFGSSATFKFRTLEIQYYFVALAVFNNSWLLHNVEVIHRKPLMRFLVELYRDSCPLSQRNFVQTLVGLIQQSGQIHSFPTEQHDNLLRGARSALTILNLSNFVGKGLVVVGADISGSAFLCGAKFVDTVFEQCDFRDADLSNTTFERSTVFHPSNKFGNLLPRCSFKITDVLSAVLSPGGNFVALTVQQNSTIRIFSVASNTCVHKLSPWPRRHHAIHTVFSADERLIACWNTQDYIIHLYSAETGKQLHKLRDNDEVQSSELGVVTFLGNSDFLVCSVADGSVGKWDCATGLCVNTVRFNRFYRQLVVSGDGDIVVGATGNVPDLMSLTSSTVVKQLKTGNFGDIKRLMLSPNNKYLAAITADKCIVLWPLEDSHPIPETRLETNSVASVNCVTLPLEPSQCKPVLKHSTTLTHLAFSADSALLAASDGNGLILLLSSETNTLKRELLFEPNCTLTFSGTRLVAASARGVKTWETTYSGYVPIPIPSHVAFSASNSVLAVAGRNSVELWAVNTGGELLRTFSFGNTATIGVLGFLPTKLNCAQTTPKLTTNTDNLHNITSDHTPTDFINNNNNDDHDHTDHPRIHHDQSNDDHEHTDHQCIHEISTKNAECVRENTDHQCIASNRENADHQRMCENVVCFVFDEWLTSDLTTMKTLSIFGEEESVSFLRSKATISPRAFSADGSTFVSVDLQHGNVEIMSTATGESTQVLQRVVEVGDCVVLSPDSTLVATLKPSGLVTVWNVERKSDIATRQIPGVSGIGVFSRDARMLAVGADSVIHVMKIAETSVVQLLGHQQSITDIAINHDTIVSCDMETLRFWELATGTIQKVVYFHVMKLCFSQDGNHLACCGVDGISVWRNNECGVNLTRCAEFSCERCVIQHPDICNNPWLQQNTEFYREPTREMFQRYGAICSDVLLDNYTNKVTKCKCTLM